MVVAIRELPSLCIRSPKEKSGLWASSGIVPTLGADRKARNVFLRNTTGLAGSHLAYLSVPPLQSRNGDTTINVLLSYAKCTCSVNNEARGR